MTPEDLKNIRHLRSMPLPLEFDSTRINKEEGVLYDVVMCEEGEAKGHGLWLEEEFIVDLIAYDQKHFNKRGLKNRFDHPGACEGTMGNQMGRFRNFRTRQKGGKMQAIADLYLLDAAEVSPTKPSMKSWMLKMAEEAPDFVMQSIVFNAGRYYQKFKNGDKRYIWEYQKDENGDLNWVSSDATLGKVFVEFGTGGEHFYTDTVEAGAATDSLFSTQSNPHLFVSKALSWLEEQPQIKAFAQENPEKVFEFLKALGIAPQTPKKFTMNLKEIFFGKEAPTDDLTITPEELTALRGKMKDAETAMGTLTEKFAAITKEVDALKATVQEKEKALTAAQKRITELEAEPADKHTEGAAGDEGSSVKTFHKDPITAKAMASYEARKKRKAA